MAINDYLDAGYLTELEALKPNAARMLHLLLRLHRTGDCSEGQISNAAQISRVAVRVLKDRAEAEHRAALSKTIKKCHI